jgi:surfeit locus 1 family protein
VYRFRPRWWALALGAVGCAAGVLLGNWQTGRAEEKRLVAATERRVALRGVLVPKHTVFLDNKTHRGRAGYHVVQPLRLSDGKHVLVNRGWVAAPPRREQLPEVVTPAGEVSIEGVHLTRFPRVMSAGGRAEGRVWQNLEIEDFAAWSGLPLQSHAVEQHSDAEGKPADGLIREWPRPDAQVDKHRSYALQWYSLAALCVILVLVLGFRRNDLPAA